MTGGDMGKSLKRALAPLYILTGLNVVVAVLGVWKLLEMIL